MTGRDTTKWREHFVNQWRGLVSYRTISWNDDDDDEQAYAVQPVFQHKSLYWSYHKSSFLRRLGLSRPSRNKFYFRPPTMHTYFVLTSSQTSIISIRNRDALVASFDPCVTTIWYLAKESRYTETDYQSWALCQPVRCFVCSQRGTL